MSLNRMSYAVRTSRLADAVGLYRTEATTGPAWDESGWVVPSGSTCVALLSGFCLSNEYPWEMSNVAISTAPTDGARARSLSASFRASGRLSSSVTGA